MTWVNITSGKRRRAPRRSPHPNPEKRRNSGTIYEPNLQHFWDLTCSQVQGQSFICTIAFQSSWIANENDSGPGVMFSEFNNQAGFEGISVAYTGPSAFSNSTGNFSSPLPNAPATACTPDAQGYCASLVSTTQLSVCTSTIKNIHGGNITVPRTASTYQVFKQLTFLELQETATETTNPSGSLCTAGTPSWSPNNPSVQYGDSSLP